jgi:formate dehydrogenase maturation protein FdhE
MPMRDPIGGTHRVECYCPACGSPVSCTVANDAVTERTRNCKCELDDHWLGVIDWAAVRKQRTAAFFRRLMG